MHLSRRHFFLGSFALSAAAQKRSTPEPPNVVVVLAGNLGSWMLGCYGNKEIHTPNIDRLARSGTRFANHCSASSVDQAGRAVLFSGRTPMEVGADAGLAREILLPDLLAGAGYHCGFVGGWHGDAQQPRHHYDFWYALSGDAPRYQDPTMSLNGKMIEEKGYLADLLTAKAGQFIEQQQAGRPFFLTLSYPHPHPPYQGHPQRYYDLYAQMACDTIGWQPAAPNAAADKDMFREAMANIRRGAAATTALDDQIPALLNKLNGKGFLNTLVVFTSGAGWLLGRHGLWSDGRASEPSNMYEEVIQTPMIWYWLGKVAPDNMRPELVGGYDFLPSVAEATGVALPSDRNLCGRSYLNLATNKPLPKKQSWRSLVFAQFGKTEMAREPRYKAVMRDGGQGPGELYDLRADPFEKVNQYDNGQFLSARDRLASELAAWKKKYPA